MEVHHHPKVEKKNFKEYFLEFLMIFLAVTMGFFAESLREHIVEANKENDYIKTFIEDVKTDTVKIKNRIFIIQNLKLKAIDSLLFLLSTHQIKGHENDLYFLGRNVTRYPIFVNNDRTITQLKNAGELRLIRNEAAADSIMSYEKTIEFIYKLQNDEDAERKELYSLLCRMYNPFVFDKITIGSRIVKPQGNPPLRSYDSTVQQDLAFYLTQIKGSDYLMLDHLQNLEAKAENTIAFLHKEYHIE
ncbi:MAG: hypothetical protein JST87_17745 [Bacteroidetes bacterium]|nr:hypothetical protein [Bacteroidota bacterium]